MSTDFPLEILYEDSRFMALNKPAGLLSIPAERGNEPSLLLRLAQRFPRQRFLVVHRIDRQTSGILLFARDENAHRLANGWFSNHGVTKEYLALAQGDPRLPAFRVNRAIEGKPSLSQIQISERFLHPEHPAFLARVRIATGRKHQIRLHLEAEGFPILGDTRYSGVLEFRGIRFPRFALHAERLVLPKEGDAPSVEIRAPLPADFEAWLRALRANSPLPGVA